MREDEEKEALKKILETMTVEERVGYLAARQKYQNILGGNVMEGNIMQGKTMRIQKERVREEE